MTITISEKHIKSILLILLISLMCIFLVQVTYAKYKKYAQGIVNNNVAKWNIKVNNESIKNKTTLTSSIIPVFDGDIYTKSGVLAPDSNGYFDIVIDATNSDVSFSYDIEVDKADTNTISDLKITGFSKEEGVIINNVNNTISGEIEHNTASTSIRVYIEWDDVNGTMNNSEDTVAAVGNVKNANVLVSIHLTQLKN